MKRFGTTLAALAALLFSSPVPASEPPRLHLEIEGGPVWQSRNDVQIPNDESGTRFSLVDLIGNGAWTSGRVYATWNMSAKHSLRILVAPLTIRETARPVDPLEFSGGSFPAGEPTEATYKFNSYRLGYRYRFHDGDAWTWRIGFTAKIRDAKVRLEQDAVAAEKTDVGFVPLLHLSAEWRLASRWSLDLDIEALAGGPGRAEDASLKLRYPLGERLSLAAGYRLVEGGADVDEVYNFAWLHYAVLSLGAAF